MATRKSTDPFETIRKAFEDLETSEKAAFVLEATFETIGQALAETGRRAAETIEGLGIDSWFQHHADEPESESASQTDSKKTTTKRRSTTSKGSTSTGKTAGKTAGKSSRRKPPKKDDDS